MTLEHLLTHTSGIADYCDEYGDEPYEMVWQRANPAAVRAPRDLLPLFAELPALAAPGTEVRYCNAAFVLAGLAIEALTGQSFYDAVAEAVLEPAGMSATGYPALDDVIPDIAVGYLPPADDDPAGPWRSNLYAIPARASPMAARSPLPRISSASWTRSGRGGWSARPGGTRCSGRGSGTSARRRRTGSRGRSPARAAGGTWVTRAVTRGTSPTSAGTPTAACVSWSWPIAPDVPGRLLRSSRTCYRAELLRPR